MIHFFTGDNSFEIQRAVQGLVEAWLKDSPRAEGGLELRPEKIDGNELLARDLPDLLTASTLFSERRMVIIKGLAENPSGWRALGNLLPRLSEDISLILIEPKPDKRTTIFKTLKSASQYREIFVWTERDSVTVVAWVINEAANNGLKLDKKLAQLIVDKVGFDQWDLSNALDKLITVSFDQEIDEKVIDNLIDARPVENVFNLLEMALSGKRRQLHQSLATLELSEDPYRLFALLSSQIFQLSAIAFAKDSDKPSSDFGIHPFMASKLASQSKKLSSSFVAHMVKVFAKADADLKSSRGDTWMIIEKALVEATT